MQAFVAGATGATGRAFVAESATIEGLVLKLHVRPATASKTPLARDPRAAVLELSDAPALARALDGCGAVISFVGTMRSRFGAGDTYASSDVGATRALVDGARAAGVPRFLLLSSYGAGHPVGGYLSAKAEAEGLVRASGLAWTIVRPSVLVTPDGGPEGTHGARPEPPGMRLALGALGAVPGLGGFADDARPMPLDVLARAFLAVLARGSAFDGRILGGRDLWPLGRS